MIQTREITLGPGEFQEVAFFFTPTVVKVHSVSVNGLTRSFNVLELLEAEFTVTDLIITPATVYVGEPVAISVIVTNIGNTTGTKTITLEII